MKAQSNCVPRLEKLEDRSIPGSLLGLTDPSLDLFADLLSPASDAKPAERGLTGWSESLKANRVPLALPVSLAPSNPLQTPAPSLAHLAAAGKATPARDELGLAIAALLNCADPGSPGTRHAPFAANRVRIVHESGSGAFAFYNHTVGCISTYVTVVGNESTRRSWPPQGIDGTGALVGVAVFVNDDCQDFPVLDAQGFSNDLEMFRMAPDLRSATFSGTIQGVNVLDGQGIDFQVSVTWVATGKAVSESAANRFDGSLEVLHTQERPAIASGTVISGTTNYLTRPASDAALQAVQSLVVTR